MTFNPEIWIASFEANEFPSFPCPRCRMGTLRPIKSTVKTKDAHKPFTYEEYMEFGEDHIDRRFSMLASCSRSSCHEVVALMGDFTNEEGEYEGNQVIVEVHRIRGIYPAPRMIEIPEKVPHAIEKKLEESFSLYWTDYSACANALRTAAELLLNILHVPKTHRIKATASKPGKVVDLNFNGRIQWLEKRNKSKGKLFHGLRRLGNSGSHPGEKVKQSDVHSGFKVMEHVLYEVYVKKDILSVAVGLGAKKT